MRYLLLLSVLFCSVACKNSSSKNGLNKKDSLPATTNIDASIKGNFSNQRKLVLTDNEISAFFQQYKDVEVYDSAVTAFYQMRERRYAWFDENGLTEPAHNLFNRLSNLKDEGLRMFPPYIDELDSMMMADQVLSVEKDYQTELLLSALYFYYAKHVWEGVDEKESIAQEWYLPRKKVNAGDYLDSLLSNSSNQSNFEKPLYKQYYLLRDALKKYYQLSESGGWEQIHTRLKKIQLKDSLPEIIAIKTRLVKTGELAVHDSSMVFNEELLDAVKKFQENNGLESDGIIGAGVLTAMNVSVEKRIEQIMINMERCRWVPAQLSNEYLVVNIPDYKLYAFKGDSLLWDMNVVVGKALHKTVIFYGELKYVVFSPYWNVPNSIYKAEIVPGMAKDPAYLEKHNMEKYGNTVRQKPGPNNSLGLVKFLFPNSYNIYLHDTPSKNLFSRSNRAFSHGCIRVADPLFLSKYLLRDEPEWTEEKIVAAMHKGKERYVQLKETVPVFIAYLTAWVSGEGALQFREDIYKRDERLAKTILKK
jgi:murein L,D-transpeptidase YcbB/YkuD